MANPVIGIEVQAKLDKLFAELKQLGPGMEREAKAMTAALAKEIRASTAAMKRLGDSGKEAAKGIGATTAATANLRSQVFDIAQGLSAGTNPLVILNQQGPQVAEAMMAAGGGVSALAAAMAPLAAAALSVGSAVTVAVGAWRAYHEEAATALRVGAELADNVPVITSLYRDQEAAVRSLAVAQGLLTEGEAAALGVRERAHRELAASLVDEQARVKELHGEQATLTTQYADLAERVQGVVGWLNPLGYVIDGLTTSSSELEGEIGGVIAGMERQIGAAGDYITRTAEATAATVQLTEAKKAAVDWGKLLAERFDEERERAGKLAAGLADLHAQAMASQAAQLSGHDAIAFALDADIAAIEAQRETLLALARTDQERADIAIAAEDAIIDRRREAAAETRDIAEAAAEESAKMRERDADEYDKHLDRLRERTAAAWQDVASSSAGFLGDVSGALADSAEEMSETNKGAARQMFVASQAAAAAQAIVNTALGITQALTLPPPADAVKAALVAATGAVQLATIMAEKPSFHAGGIMYPDERTARVLGGEAVLNRQATAALGPGGVAALNQGGASVSAAPALLRIGRLEAREIVRMDARSGGESVALVRRVTARGGRPPGRSGRGPVA